MIAVDNRLSPSFGHALMSSPIHHLTIAGESCQPFRRVGQAKRTHAVSATSMTNAWVRFA
jgi:hypothetical protein